MIYIKANLVAGYNHKKYTQGANLPAIIFVDATSTDQAESRASLELAELGWASIEIERFKEMIDSDHGENFDGPERDALLDARETGFGIVVYP